MDKESRMAPAKKWILQKIAEVASEIGLKIRAEWSTDEHSKHEDKYTQYVRYFVVLKYKDGGSDAALSFDNEDLRQYPGNTKNLCHRIRAHLEKWQSHVGPPT